MKKTKLIALMTIVAVMATGISGCGKDKDSSKKNNIDTTKSVGIEEEYVNCIDMPATISTIKVNDEEMVFPIDIAKLKESISLGVLEQTSDNHMDRAVLMDSDASIGTVNLYSESGNVEEDGFIHFIEVTEGSPWYISIGGVTYGASIDEVKNAIGKPIFENGNVDGTYRVYYENCRYEYIAFAFEDGKLKTISIEYLPQEWRE